MKLSEIKGEKALDTLADLIEPLGEIVTDPEIQEMHKAGMPRIKMIKPAIKNHKKAVVTVLALLDGENPDTYEVDLLTLPRKMMEVINDPYISEVFQSQSQRMPQESFGSATVNTEE